MTAAGALADALEAHFVKPEDPTSGIVLREVTAPRSSRRIDVLAMSLWSSRGHGIDAVEIKVDKRDYQREISAPAKADPWWRNSNRFWICAPSTLIADPNELPPGWGLLVPGQGRRFKVVVKAEDRTLEPNPELYATIIARQVNAADQKLRLMLGKVRDEERQKAREQVQALRLELMAGSDPEVRKALDMIRAVERAAGVRIDEWSWDEHFTAAEFGAAVRTALDAGRTSNELGRKVADLQRELRARAAWMTKTADELAAAHAASTSSSVSPAEPETEKEHTRP